MSTHVSAASEAQMGRSDYARALLASIHEPTVVGVPPANAFHELVVLPDGEIRHYGYRGVGAQGRWIYLSSRDCGMSWQEYPTPAGCPGACVRSPWSSDWITIIEPHEYTQEGRLGTGFCGLKDGLHLARSSSGIDGPFAMSCIVSERHMMVRQPMALRSRKRWVCAGQHRPANGQTYPVVFISDDDGRSWRRVALETVEAHKAEWPHQGVRWQNWACEPTIVELSDGRLWMLMRTSQDNHYESFSLDGGETWSRPAPSRFYGTITMPTLFRMSDGRILFIWCNTTPLPELDHAKQLELEDWERHGGGEDYFTNRDAIHIAISEDDGKSWIGFRELALNPLRNDSDFRSVGGNAETLDKSMHQSQALELPGGKILVSHGQHSLCRRLVILDAAWLYERDRRDDFRYGLRNWSAFTYVKGLAGNFRGITGHCAYNRRPGPQLVPSPDGEPREVLQIARHPDGRLLHERQGAVWNFPAGHSGEVTVSLRQPKGSHGMRICLMDRWLNPVDPVAHHFAAYALTIEADGRISQAPSRLAHDRWHSLTMRWTDAANDAAQFELDGNGAWLPLPLIRPSVNGLCYLHLQSIAGTADTVGTLIREVAASVGDEELDEEM